MQTMRLTGSSNTLTTWWGEPIHGKEEGDRGWDGWMASSTQWTWMWTNSGRQWKVSLACCSLLGLRVGHDFATKQLQQIHASSHHRKAPNSLTWDIWFSLINNNHFIVRLLPFAVKLCITWLLPSPLLSNSLCHLTCCLLGLKSLHCPPNKI